MSTAVHRAPEQFLPSPSQLAVAYSVCRHITRSAAKNFYYAFLVLPRHKREALCAVYAFMRRCDDIADDESLPLEERRTRLGALLQDLHRVQAGQPTDEAVLLALTDTQRRYGVSSDLLDELAYGTMMDVQGQDAVDRLSSSSHLQAPELKVHYRRFEDLRQYCYRVASVVGLVCIRIFGFQNPAAEPLAERCGLAFQLTNIIRDVAEDAQAGRLYIPENDLAAFGIAVADLRGPAQAARFRPLLAMEAERARDFYRAGDELIPMIDEDSQAALWVLITTYRALLEKIAKKGYNVFRGKIRLSTGKKLSILARGFLKRLM
jgi:15-cis-phytoene synthase